MQHPRTKTRWPTGTPGEGSAGEDMCFLSTPHSPPRAKQWSAPKKRRLRPPLCCLWGCKPSTSLSHPGVLHGVLGGSWHPQSLPAAPTITTNSHSSAQSSASTHKQKSLPIFNKKSRISHYPFQRTSSTTPAFFLREENTKVHLPQHNSSPQMCSQNRPALFGINQATSGRISSGP